MNVEPALALALALLLAACGARDEPDASGITPSEAEALNDAAAMLDNESVRLDALDAAKGQPK